MNITLNKFRIELNSLISRYREQNIPAYLLSGVMGQEMAMLKDFEIAELTMTIPDKKEDISDE